MGAMHESDHTYLYLEHLVVSFADLITHKNLNCQYLVQDSCRSYIMFSLDLFPFPFEFASQSDWCIV